MPLTGFVPLGNLTRLSERRDNPPYPWCPDAPADDDIQRPNVAALQSNYSISIKVDLTYIRAWLVSALLGDPLAVLYCDMQTITPHWYLAGDD
jgi:hypothetical protein